MRNTKELSQSISVEGLVPQHVAENNPDFVDFLEAYYDWMEDFGNANNVIHKFGNLHQFVNYFANRTKNKQDANYDSFARELYELYVQEYSKSYPVEKAIREDLFIKSIREALSCKGSVESIKNFFRTIYGQEAEVIFPEQRRITYNAQTTYTIKTHIEFVPDDPVTQEEDESIPSALERDNKLKVLNVCVGRYFVSELGTIAQLQNVTYQDKYDKRIVELQFQNLQGGYFVSGDFVTYQFTLEEVLYFSDTVNLNVSYGSPGDKVYYNGNNKTLSFYVGGIITEYDIQTPGSGYRLGETVVISTGEEIQSGLAVISNVGSNGEILELMITNSGYGFNAFLKIDDRASPDYSDGLAGGRIFSGGTGAIIYFKAGAISFWDPRETVISNVQYLDYSENNSSLAGAGSFGEYFQETNSEDPTDALPYIAEGYYEKLANSSNPVDYPWIFAKGSDSRNFGKLYFEMQFVDNSEEFGEINFDFNEHFNMGGMYTVGFVSDTCQIQTQNNQLGNIQESWGVWVNRYWTEFRSYGSVIRVNRPIPTVNGMKTIRFVLDLVDNACYVGCVDGWFDGASDNSLTAQPINPVFDGITYDSGIFLGATGKFIPQVSLRCATRFSQFKYSIPENLVGGQGQAIESFVFDYDPFRVPVLPWDYSNSTIVNSEDEYKLTSEDVVYRYKIRVGLSPRIWNKIYRACVHPAGTTFETQIGIDSQYTDIVVGQSDLIVSSPDNIQGESFYDMRPIIEGTFKSISDLQEYASYPINYSMNISDSIDSFKDAPIYLLNQDLIVSCVESVVETS
jgi:hypothetical protein